MDIPISGLSAYGIPGIMLAVFIWLHVRGLAESKEREAKIAREAMERETALGERLDKTQDYIRDQLIPIIEQNNRALTENSSALRSVTLIIEKYGTDRFERNSR